MLSAILQNIPGMKNAAAVPRLNGNQLSEDEFNRKFVHQSLPCVIADAVRHWPAAQKWTDREYLKGLAGQRRVLFFPHENHLGMEKMMAGQRELSLRDALDLLHSPAIEVGTLGIQEDLTELRRDIGGFSFLTRADMPFLYPPVRFFLYRNAGSAWHFHPLDETLMCQIAGRKIIGLLNAKTPHQSALQDLFFGESYYDNPHAFDGMTGTALNWFFAEVNPGDALYIPPLWWHGIATDSEGFGATAAIPWRSPLPVIAETIRKMSAGEVELLGSASEIQVGNLVAVAKQLGLQRELAIAMQRATGTQTQV